MTSLQPTRIDAEDPASRGLDIQEQVDRELGMRTDTAGLTLLVPEHRWGEFLDLSGCEAHDGWTEYNGVRLIPGPVSAVAVQEGF